VFDWNNSYINFRIFEDTETKSAIVFHVRLICVQNEAPKRDKNESFWLEGLHQSISILLGMSNQNPLLFFKALSKAKIGLEKDDKVQSIRF